MKTNHVAVKSPSALVHRWPRQRRDSATVEQLHDHHQATDAHTGARRQRACDLTRRKSTPCAETRAHKCDSCRGWHLASRPAFVDARFVPANRALPSALVVEAVAA